MDAIVNFATMQINVPIWGLVSFVGTVVTIIVTVRSNITQNNKNHRYMIAYLKLQVCLARQHLQAIVDPKGFKYDKSCDEEFVKTLESLGRAD
jgi:hypothetical protein